jgi:hypothetical protein
MPAIPPSRPRITELSESHPDPHSIGTELPAEDPTNIPSMIIAFRLMAFLLVSVHPP